MTLAVWEWVCSVGYQRILSIVSVQANLPIFSVILNHWCGRVEFLSSFGAFYLRESHIAYALFLFRYVVLTQIITVSSAYYLTSMK